MPSLRILPGCVVVIRDDAPSHALGEAIRQSFSSGVRDRTRCHALMDRLRADSDHATTGACSENLLREQLRTRIAVARRTVVYAATVGRS
jgi:hypothetical protein